MKQLGWLAIACALAACGKGGRPASELRAPGGVVVAGTAPACVERLHGQVIAESAAVDATDAAVYWLDYNFGTLQRRSRAEGPVETLVEWPGEHLAESMRIGNGYVWWTSKAAGGLFRLPLDGGTPEQVVAASDMMLTDIEIVGDVVYAAGIDGDVLWWRSPGERGVLETGDEDPALAATPDALYIGARDQILRVGAPGAGTQRALEVVGRVEQLAVRGDTFYWVDDAALWRHAGGESERIARAASYMVIAAVEGGVYAGSSNLVYFLADGSTELRPVAIAATDITDLEVRGASVFVGTAMGSVHELCPDLAAGVALKDVDASCTDCEWYASGDVSRRGEDYYYADGTPLSDADGVHPLPVP